MTALGAAMYGGFFGLAALWLVLTAERGPARETAADQLQPAERSNSENASAAHAGSSSCAMSQSSSK